MWRRGDSAPAASTAARTSLLQSNDSDCPNGGILVETGIKDNGNSILDSSEVNGAEKVCNGSKGASGANGLNMLVHQEAELACSNCASGGVRFDIGFDTNSNNVLDAFEITSSEFLCGVNGIERTEASSPSLTKSPSVSGLLRSVPHAISSLSPKPSLSEQ